jgi:SAM-dependent methyltransferase
MQRIPSHPLAKYPLDGLKGFQCSVPECDRAYLHTLMLESTLRHCGKHVRGRTLDVGCGQKPYQNSFFSSAAEYIGVDYLTDRSRPDVVGSATDLPFADQTFDTVVCTEVLEHVPDPLKALMEMNRVLKESGKLILSTPMYWPRHEVPYDFFRYPYDGLLSLASRSGLNIEEIYNRGRSYCFIGQVVQQTQPIASSLFNRLLNKFFLLCDRRLKHDIHTLGWTLVASKA